MKNYNSINQSNLSNIKYKIEKIEIAIVFILALQITGMILDFIF